MDGFSHNLTSNSEPNYQRKSYSLSNLLVIVVKYFTERKVPTFAISIVIRFRFTDIAKLKVFFLRALNSCLYLYRSREGALKIVEKIPIKK